MAGISQLVIIAILVAAAFLILRQRLRRIKPRTKSIPRQSPKLTGCQINTVLHPRMGKACLFDSGTQHGRGFRRKEGPNLPHDENCRCESVAFSFTSTEVFHGALRKITRLDCSIPGLPEIQTRRLLELLKSAETRPVPASREEYLAAVTPGEFPEAWQDEVRQFLLQRHAFLLETTGQAAVKATKAPKTGRAKPPAAKKTARVKTVTATAAEKSGAEKTKTSARGSNQKKVKKTAAGKSGTEQKTRAAPKRTTTRKTPSTAAAGKAAGKTAGKAVGKTAGTKQARA